MKNSSQPLHFLLLGLSLKKIKNIFKSASPPLTMPKNTQYIEEPPFLKLHLTHPLQGVVLNKLKPYILLSSHQPSQLCLAKAISDELRIQKQTLSLAESCTGGLIAHKITALPRASEIFMGSVVVYKPEAKRRVLGVPEEWVSEEKVVSEDTAKSMAQGARELFKSHWALSTTGWAGRPKDQTLSSSSEKPGHVCLGLSNPSLTIAVSYLSQTSLPRTTHQQRWSDLSLALLWLSLKRPTMTKSWLQGTLELH